MQMGKPCNRRRWKAGRAQSRQGECGLGYKGAERIAFISWAIYLTASRPGSAAFDCDLRGRRNDRQNAEMRPQEQTMSTAQSSAPQQQQGQQSPAPQQQTGGQPQPIFRDWAAF